MPSAAACARSDCHVPRLVRTLCATCEPARPARAVAQLAKCIQQHGVALQWFHPADLNDHDAAVVRAVVRGTRAAFASTGAYTTSTRAFDAGSVDAVKWLLQTTVPGATRHASRSSQWRPAAMCIHRTRRDGMTFRDRTKQRERPRLMTDDDIGALGPQHRGERAPRAPHRERA